MRVIRRDWSKLERAAHFAHTGRRPGTLAGSYVSDLAALGKAIVLCLSCATKFNAERVGYSTSEKIPVCRGRCDGCKRFSNNARLFMKG